MDDEVLSFSAELEEKGFVEGMNKLLEAIHGMAEEVKKTGMTVDQFSTKALASFDTMTTAIERQAQAQGKAGKAGHAAAEAERQGADKATEAIDRTGRATDELGRKLQKAGDEGSVSFGKMAKYAAGFFTLQKAKEFGQKMFDVRKEMESLQVSFETLAGADVGKQLYEDIKQFTLNTPMMMGDLAKGAQTLLGFNIEAQKVMPILKQIGDISMGDSQKFNSLTLAFAQMSSTGKLMGQDLLQMINAGFNPLVVISEKTGKSVAELKDEMSKGAISVEMVEEAFRSATEEGGKFHGMLEQQSKTLGGAYSNLLGAIDEMFNEIGEKSEGIMAGAIDAATVLVQNYEKVGQILLGLVATYGIYKAAVMAVTAIQGLQTAGVGALTAAETVHYGWLVLCEKAQKLLNKTMLANPYVLVATLIAGVAAALWNMKSQQDLVNEAQDEYNRKKEEAIAKEEEHKRKIDELIKVAGDESLSTESRKMAMSELMKKYPSLFKNYDTEIAALKDIAYWKAKIAEIESGKSIQLAQNELLDVNRQINELEAKSRRIKQTTKNVYNHQTLQWEKQTVNVPSLTREEQAKLQQLKNQRSKLNKQMKQDADSNYLKDLTGVSNRDLQKQIKERENLLAQIKVMEQKNGGKKVSGKVQMGGVTGVYSKEDIQDQLTRLKWEQNRRADVIKNGSQNFVSEAQKAYNKEKKELDRLRSLSDPNKRRSSNKTIDVGGKTLKESELTAEELQEAIEKQKKVVEKQQKSLEGLTGKSLKASASAAAKAAKEEQKQAKEEASQNARSIQEERRYQEELDRYNLQAEQARSDARIAAIRNDAERERAEQDEQHRRSLQQIAEQADEMRKAIYEHNKKAWETEHKDSPYELTEEGKKGWKEISLSDDQQAIINARLEKENSEYARLLEERRRSERQSMYDYIKEYGSIQQQKAAIAAEYDMKIAKEGDAIQKAALEKQKQRLLSDLTFKEWQQSIDWEAVFNDLNRQSSSALEELKAKLRDMLKADGITAENAKVLAEKIRETEDLLSRRKNPIAAWLPGLRERIRLTNDAKAAEDELTAATERQNRLWKLSMADISVLQQKIRTSAGRDVGVQELSSMSADEYVKVLNLDPLGDAAKAARDEFNRLITSTIDLGKAQGDYLKAQENARKRREALDRFTSGGSIAQYFKDITAGLDFAGWANLIGTNIKSMSELVDRIGLGETEFGKSVHDFADGVGGFQSALQSLQNGDVIGAVNGIIGGFEGLGRSFGRAFGITVDADYSSYYRLVEQYDELIGVWDELIDRKSEYIGMSYGAETLKVGREALDLIEKQAEAYRELGKERLNAGSSAGSSSIGRRISKNMDAGDWKGIADSLGWSVDEAKEFIGTSRMTGLFDLTAEQIKALQEGNQVWWAKLDDDVRKYLESIIENEEKWSAAHSQMMQQLTTTTEDNVFSGFLDDLYGIADGSEEVFGNIADSWQQMVNKMVIKNLVGARYQDSLKGWYGELYKAMQKRTENGDNAEFRSDIDRLQKEYEDYVREAQEEIEVLRGVGIISGSAEAKEDKNASNVMAEKATYDQFEKYLGIATAQQITEEQIKSILQRWDGNISPVVNLPESQSPVVNVETKADNKEALLIIENLHSIANITSSNGSTTREIRELVKISNEYLLDIKKSNREILETMTERVDNLYNLMEKKL